MKKLLFALLVITAISCDENDCGCTYYQVDANLIVKDTDGNFLLNRQNFNQIYISYLVNGVIRRGDNPIFIEDLNAVRIFLNHDSGEEYPITYVKWNGTDTDTIKAKFSRHNRVLEKFWINDIEVSDRDDMGFYTFVKP